MPDGIRHPRPAPAIGRADRRREDAALLKGEGRFTADLPRPPGLLHAAFRRADMAAGRVLHLDAEAARAMPGVAAVITAREMGPLGQPAVNAFFPAMPAARFQPLARDLITAPGEPVALVLATSLAAAKDAAEVIDLEIGDAPRAPEAPAITHRWQTGAVDAAFAAARHVVGAEIVHACLAPLAMEPRQALAEIVEGRLRLHLSSQTPHRARSDLAAILGLDATLIHVIAPDIGGSFGAKASLHPEEAAIAWACRHLGRPILWQGSRTEEFLTATRGRGGRLRAEMALDEQGRALALRGALAFPLGQRLPYSAAVPGRNAARCLPGPYAIGAIDLSLEAAFGPGPAMGIYRGAGRPEAALLMERLMEAAAEATGLTPAEIRRRNLLPAEALPHRMPTGETLDSGDYPALLEALEARAASLAAACRARRARGEAVGFGLGLYVEPCGQGWESARVSLLPDGRIEGATGSTAQGQGRETAFAQILAEATGREAAEIVIRHGDTDTTPPGIGALASRSTGIGGGALFCAGQRLREMLHARAAAMTGATSLDQAPEGLRAPDGRLLRWAELAGEPLLVEERFEAPGEAWSAGAVAALIRLDRETGHVVVEEMVWLDDIGRVVNPMLARGQLIGGAAQGLGEALMERLVTDETGQLLTGSLMDYAAPRAADMPRIAIAHPARPALALNNPLGAKGVGEAGTIGAPIAIINAIGDALAAEGAHLGPIALPLTPEKIWRALAAAPQGETP